MSRPLADRAPGPRAGASPEADLGGAAEPNAGNSPASDAGVPPPLPLVTGAAGFVGTHLVRRLAATGAAVRGVDVHADVHAPPGGRAPQNGIDLRQLDVRDTPGLRPLLEGVDTVYHLASVHLEVGASEELYRDVNVRAVERLVAACAESGVRRLVHTSSVGIYGHVAAAPADEDAPKRPQTAYERTKLEGEEVALGAAARVGLQIIVLRPAWVYGPGCPRTAKLMDALRRGRFAYMGDGSNLRHPLYIDDMVDAFLTAALAPRRVCGRPYVIGGPRWMPLREMVDTFARVLEVPPPRRRMPLWAGRMAGHAAEVAFGAMGREPPISRRSLAFFRNDNAFDTSAAARELGFSPQVALEEGVRRTCVATA